jgi:hypothetical protein
MPKIRFALTLVQLLILAVSILPAAEEEAAAVKKVIREAYVEGMWIDRDEAAVRSGFHEDFVISIRRKGVLVQTTLNDWLKRSSLDGTRNERKIEHRFTDVDVVGDMASVKIELLVDGKLVYTDRLGLYKFESGWKIVSKIYHSHP